MKKLFIIDGHNVLFRSYYAIRGMTNPKGESTNALYGFIRTVYKLITDFSPSHLVAVFDGPENVRARTALYEGYKSHRKEMPQDMPQQIARAQEFCTLAGIPFLCIEGVEADDTMGTLALLAEKEGGNAYFCSSDKDLCQLISDHIFMIQLHKENLLVDKKGVEELFGVQPEQMVDYLAIVGDPSDNIPGLEGFGPKTASALLHEFKTLDALLAHPEKVKGEKKQETLRKGKEKALLSRKLATIDTGVKIPQEEAFYALKTPDLEAVRAFYQEMRFLSLLKDLESAPEKKGAEKEPPKRGITEIVEEASALDELLLKLKNEPQICIDTETSDIRPMHARLVGVGLGLSSGSTWYIPLNGKLPKERVLAFLNELIQSEAAFYGHNIKYDLHVLANEGLPLPRLSFDTMLASYVLHPEQPRHNLDHLSLEYLGIVKTPIEALLKTGKQKCSMLEVPIAEVANYCGEDVDCCIRLKELFEKNMEELDLAAVMEQLEIPLLPVLFKMERAGIYVDTEKLSALSKEVAVKIETLESQIFKIAGEKFNLNSPKQLSHILFDTFGIKPPRKTQTGFSTAASVLESLKEEHPIVDLILEYRGLEKLRSTYIDALAPQIFPKTGRIHCTFNQSVAATGRLSCQDPNLQNIPARSIEGRKIRAAFKPQKGGFSFLSLDYSQIELRLLAHLCDDPSLIASFRNGEDIHATTAAAIFNVPLEEVTSAMRQKAKAVNFGILYGQGAFGLSQSLKLEYQEAASFIDSYFKRFHRVREYIEFCKQSVRKTGRAVTMLKRHRPIPDIHSKNPALRAAAERLAINTPLQGTAADLIKLAMIDVDKLLGEHPEWGTLLLQIHDELLFEAPDEHIHTLASHVKNILEGIIPLKVPLTVDISIGKNWEEC